MTELARAFEFLEAQERDIIQLESLLTAYPALAPESEGIGEIEKASALEAWLKAQGISNIEHFDAPDPRVPSKLRPNLVATIPGRRVEGPLWIMSHLDVVPEGELSSWESDPWKVVVKDGKLYGRGVEDNQQGIVSSVFAALAFVKQGIIPERTIKLLFIADEEVGSKFGIQYLLENHSLFGKDDIIVVPDGGSADGTEIEVAEKNICWLKIRTKGKQTHAAMPDKGANALLAACDLALRVHRLEKSTFTARDPLFFPDRTTINPTKKEANVPNINTIPGEDVFYFDMRILPVYPVSRMLEEVMKQAHAIEAEYNVKIELEVIQSNESKATPADAPVVGMLAEAVKQVYGVEARPIGIGGGTVGAYLRNAGLDCVVWSKMNETAHQPNENADIANIIGDAKVFAALAMAP
ncbi:MAG TPA: M20 family metallo-hydrolase [Rectinema sp.]|jgi:succinyl-diaminopimelate desuccinylase|nr:M20 family metallo-hydrolase [Spirochaetia bacterium]OQC74504.1 MAG: Succinyl-diaminopimelate desuccinylase [Spirochaetes bacterium ADurb.Bin001]HNP93254.1 M20 family metallo-hydrolase [Rectinema sp.]HOE98906.1 M20 family metallo-hydrolase [Rectinema sp.]HOR91584.1 M20 family metallo-hydrolase [Rectinema sp.]